MSFVFIGLFNSTNVTLQSVNQWQLLINTHLCDVFFPSLLCTFFFNLF